MPTHVQTVCLVIIQYQQVSCVFKSILLSFSHQYINFQFKQKSQVINISYIKKSYQLSLIKFKVFRKAKPKKKKPGEHNVKIEYISAVSKLRQFEQYHYVNL
ncbi:Hypothetical_protein [Hexamita inflata]|uniref:Hypothetical_protein n=1 Tax=Hexamita inflata TaxID=28002 RepID=A0AA86TKL1_9EUKA|nr:Hypothetical protein HINF_LOCUS9074 [Hexamita inflata]CAI9940466.1 Hypothetical protein HINF_LOCUS28111 [Hexamita inflata]